MAHNITLRDGFFSVRQPAWHGLGQVLERYPTIEEARQIAHPWEPISEPLYRRVPTIVTHDEGGSTTTSLTEEYEEVEGFVASVRSDDGTTLGVNSDTYEIVTNKVLYEIAEAIEGEAKGSVQLETGGSLKGGKKVWLLIRLRDPLVIRSDGGTATIPYYGLQNAHDGSGALRGQATMTRIVCDNTAQMADLDATARGTEFVFRHTRSVRDRIEEAKDALAGWRHSVNEYQRFSDLLLTPDYYVTAEQAARFIEEFIPMPPPHTVSERVVNNVETARAQLQCILYGETCESISHTAYGLLQASVEYVEHYRKAKTTESRFQRSYLDKQRVIADAARLAQEVVHA